MSGTPLRSPAAREALEADVRGRCDAGDFDGAATAAIRGYGPEIYGFLVGLHRGESEADELFSLVTESLWRGLPTFAWTSTLRTWAYTIARHASFARHKAVKRDARRVQPMASDVERIAADVRTETRTFLRTEQRDALTRLRDELPPDDRMLLVLRVDRDLAWSDLARVMWSGDAEPDEAGLKREAARLRKRFQLVKERLVALGRRDGLLPDPGER